MSNYVERFRPEFTKGNNAFNKLYKVQAKEIETFNENINKVVDNNFIKTADLKGVRKYENIYKVKANANMSLEERRKVILDKILYKPPFTRQQLHEILVNLWGEGNFDFGINYDEYIIYLDVNTDKPNYYIKFKEQLRKIIPSNMYLGFAIQYTYLYLRNNFTYNQLNQSGLTYFELSQYSYNDTPYTNYYLNKHLTHSQMSDLTHAKLHR